MTVDTDNKARQDQIREIIAHKKRREDAVREINAIAEQLRDTSKDSLGQLGLLDGLRNTPEVMRVEHTLLGRAFAGNYSVDAIVDLLKLINTEEDLGQRVQKIDTFMQESRHLPKSVKVILIPALAEQLK